ncbi:DEAD/DEAH box helicase [Aestuariimicrobium kwangyangense]|uniref:DEAD/DEAH box helicase n=1 Tax=Aestuariimicrobium kwangyangense TaxID=396389 RepID=UPI0003B6B904|nr:DEAD/DEAH box helicase [Aestuariimicrobium kwangyangense]
MAIPEWLGTDARAVGFHHRAPSVGRTTDWPTWLPDDIRSSIEATGIPRPWAHQRDLADALFAGDHAAITTSTASGKTLGYLLPILAATASGSPLIGVDVPARRGQLLAPTHTALYLAPTKALAHDQYRVARSLAPAGFKVGTLDGDSDEAERRFARDHARYVLTNPDMLHLSILPNHERYTRLLANLRYVVVDEAHRYHGTFGTHVALVLRRLRRLCARYGAHPTFVLASATPTDPDRSGATLIGEPSITVIDDDASPRPARDVVLWQPTGAPTDDAAWLLARLVDAQLQTIAFVPSRRLSEVVALRAADQVKGEGRVASYRAGYLAQDRRDLEAGLQTGSLTGVAATNALELGVDVSGMDAVVVTGFPGTLAALWQQVGRAGRRDRDGLAVLIAREDPLDAYLFSHPELIFDAPVERTVLHADHPPVLGQHLTAAAQESALTSEDARWFGPSMEQLADQLASLGALRKRPTGWYWTRPDRAVDHIDIRAAGGHAVEIVDVETGRVVGSVDRTASDRELFEGAVYLHQGDQWVVSSYAPEDGQAVVRQARPGYSTQALDSSEVAIRRWQHTRSFGPTAATVNAGTVLMSSQVTGYLRRDEVTGQVWDQSPLDLPRHSFQTRAVWFTFPDEVVAELGFNDLRLASALHAVEHCGIGLLPMFAACDRWDLGGLSTPMHPDTGTATIFVHDGLRGGSGFSERGFETAESWLEATWNRLVRCGCEVGCPACVVSPKCGNANQMLDKSAARHLLELVLSGSVLEAPTH